MDVESTLIRLEERLMNILVVLWILIVLDEVLTINNYKVLSVHLVSMSLCILNSNLEDSICLK